MAKQLNNVQRVQQYLKKIFRLLNEQIFDNELEDVQVVLSNNSRVYGYYTLNNSTWVGQDGNEEFNQHEIGISAQYLANRDIGTSKHEAKQNHITSNKIFSYSTFKSYLKSNISFVSYCKENYGCHSEGA